MCDTSCRPAAAAAAFALLALVLVAAFAPPRSLAASAPASAPALPAAAVDLYDADPAHPWNLLHAALFIRRSPSGETFGIDRIDPLLWERSTHLLTEPSHSLALRALGTFLNGGDQRAQDPLKRAMLQSDLWAAFDWTAPPYDRDFRAAERAELQTPLARAVRRLGLGAAQVERLPDNYADAVASGAYPAHFDPAAPDRPFLPDDLFRPDGPWVLLGIPDIDPIAAAHTQFARGRSDFLVFLNTPGGRAATLDYLRRLATFPRPWRLNPRFAHPHGEPDPLELNPDLPQFEPGTQVALVRQLVVVDDQGRLAATHITQSVQLRMYREVAAPTPTRPAETNAAQATFQFELSRRMLFAGERGGLRAVGPEEEDFVQFLSVGFDPFDDRGPAIQSRVMQCTTCHAAAGIFSVHSFTRAFAPHGTRPPDLSDFSLDWNRQTTIRWKQRQYEWGLLEGLMRDR